MNGLTFCLLFGMDKKTTKNPVLLCFPTKKIIVLDFIKKRKIIIIYFIWSVVSVVQVVSLFSKVKFIIVIVCEDKLIHCL